MLSIAGAIGGIAEPAEHATTLGALFPNRNEFYRAGIPRGSSRQQFLFDGIG
ncbi:hypothetical protein [Burkholderia sp. Ac-20344]|uniref:hypothetical protein n=1 Tax=Burkholderia sp. Ac-20344 TaxID=2703890 RepID=UPI00197C930C|nr:hypothetical protein [Burkholderia sp. Ac-20344]MBN3831683.1 hypothetical protein [Burkholderia sp. Ac-20344]